MDKAQSKKLLYLIEELRLPISPKDVRVLSAKLSSEEAKLLIEKYQIVSEYEDQVGKTASIVNPEKFKEIEKEYNKKRITLKDEYKNKLEKIQEDLDYQLDGIERSKSKDFKEISERLNVKFNDLDSKYKQFYSKATSGFSSD